jgi:fumarylacetoacetate (FAA) hydrolase family protein
LCTRLSPGIRNIVRRKGKALNFMRLSKKDVLPKDWRQACLVGRMWSPGKVPGPSPVGMIRGKLYDLTAFFPTTSELLNTSNPCKNVEKAVALGVPEISDLASIIENTEWSNRDPKSRYFLSPCDLQAIRACGVTFVSSMIERVIEEYANGDLKRASEIRKKISDVIGLRIHKIKPGSSDAMKLKRVLVREGLWSQYLEVGIGRDAEVFNKAQPLSAVGTGAQIGIRSDSSWNNPEPELVLSVNRAGQIVGATLGNDVNLRDFEGRSALLLGKAKDNNASCAVGPFVRLFDRTFKYGDLLKMVIKISIKGRDGYTLRGISDLSAISRSPKELVRQAINRSRQYPDGLFLFLGTQFAPTSDRSKKGEGFTHKLDDTVSIRSDLLGELTNDVTLSNRAPTWSYGLNDLMRNLSLRGLLADSPLR